MTAREMTEEELAAALTAKLATAERERDEAKADLGDAIGRGWGDDAYIAGLEERLRAAEARIKIADAIVANNATTAELLARADAAEAKLAALVEQDAIIKGLGFEVGLDERGIVRVYERGIVRVYAGGYDGWVCARESEAGRSTVHFDGLGEALAHTVTEEAEARADAAEAKLAALVEAWDAWDGGAVWDPGLRKLESAIEAARGGE